MALGWLKTVGGSSWGLNGYFWLSYEDATIGYFSAIDVVPSNTYNNIYSHDGGVSPTYYSTSVNPMANVFTAEKDELLSAVGIVTYDTDPKQSSYNYTINIYKNPTSLNASVSGFSFTNLVHTQTGEINGAGYSNIPLSQGVVLSEGDTFVISVECEAPIGTDCYWYESDGSDSIITATVGVLEHQTYYYYKNSSKWYDASTISVCQDVFNARIKAITVIGKSELSVAPTMQNIGYGKTLSASSLTGGVVIDDVTNLQIEGAWQFVDSTIIPTVGQVVEVKFIPTSTEYAEITTTIIANVSLVTPTITITTPKTNYSVNEQVNLTITASNANNLALNDVGTMVVTYNINGGTEQTISNKSFIVPTNASANDVITITVKCYAVSGKYLQSTQTHTLKVVYLTTVSSVPSASSIYYGQSLSGSSLSGGVVIDSYSLEQVSGTWQFVNKEIVPTQTETQQVKFVPENSNYSEILKNVSVAVVKTQPQIEITLSKTQFEVGDEVVVNVTVKNTYNLSLQDFGEVTLYYLIEGSQTKTQIINNTFMVSSQMAGKQLSVVAEIESVEGKYTQTSQSLSASVLQTENPTEDDSNTDQQPDEEVEQPQEPESTPTQPDSGENNQDSSNKENENSNLGNNPETGQNVNTKIIMYGLIGLFGVPILFMIISLIVKRKKF